MLGRIDGLPRGDEPTDELFFDHPRTWGAGFDDQLYDFTFVHDVDGDGADDLLADVAWEGARQYALASGATLINSDSAALTDLLVLGEPYLNGQWGAPEGGTALGDADRDGADDVLSYVSYDDGTTSTQVRCLGLVSGAALGAGTDLWGAVLTELCEEEDATVGGQFASTVSDVDDDGLRDALVSVTSDHDPNQVCLLASSRFPTSGRGDLMEALGPCYAGDGNVIGDAAVADLSRDDVPELHVRYEDRRGDGLDSILSLDGFLVPWDDASKW